MSTLTKHDEEMILELTAYGSKLEASGELNRIIKRAPLMTEEEMSKTREVLKKNLIEFRHYKQQQQFTLRKYNGIAERAAKVLIERLYSTSQEAYNALQAIRSVTKDKKLRKQLKFEISDMIKGSGPTGRFAARWSNLAKQFQAEQKGEKR